MAKINFAAFRNPLLLLVLVILCHGSLVKSQFMIDDFSFLRPELKASQYQNIADFFLKNTAHHFNPLDTFVNVQLFKFFPHAAVLYGINLVLFYINVLLLYAFVRLLTSRQDIALLTAIFFAVHPFNAEVISHITLNSALWCAAALQLSLIFFWRSVSSPTQKERWPFISLGFFLIALLSLETALLFPLVLSVLIAASFDQDFRKNIGKTLPFWISAGIYFAIWCLKAGAAGGFAEKIQHLQISFGSFLATIGWLLNWYLGNLLFPEDIVFIRNVQPLTESIMPWIGWLVLLLGIASFLFLKWQREIKGFALGWFVAGFLFLIPASIIHAYSMGMIIEPYWFYFYSMGFFLLLAVLLTELAQKIGKGVWRALVLAIVLFWGIASYQQHVIGRTEVGYLQHWLEKSPGNLLPRMMLGSLYGYEKRFPIPDSLVEEMSRQADLFIFKNEFSPASRLLERLINEKKTHPLHDSWQQKLQIIQQH